MHPFFFFFLFLPGLASLLLIHEFLIPKQSHFLWLLEIQLRIMVSLLTFLLSDHKASSVLQAHNEPLSLRESEHLELRYFIYATSFDGESCQNANAKLATD